MTGKLKLVLPSHFLISLVRHFPSHDLSLLCLFHYHMHSLPRLTRLPLTHSNLHIHAPYLPSIPDSSSTSLLCHPHSPQFLSPLSTLSCVSPTSTPFRSLALIFIASFAHTHFHPTPTILALSLHIPS